MAHKVEKMFSVHQEGANAPLRELPWHYGETGQDGRTVILEEAPKTWQEARVPAGLDWDPIEEPLYRRVPAVVDGEPTTTYEAVEGHKLIVRSDNNMVLDTALEQYELITNSDMGDIIETFMSGHEIKFETAGCLDSGRQVWALLQMGDFLEIKGDPSPTARYIALLNRHDGHGACKAIATNIRVVCANTWHYADTQSEASATTFAFHHRSQWRQRMAELQADVKAALSGAEKEMKAYAELADEMILKTVSDEQVSRWVDEFVYPTKLEHKLKPKALENVTIARQKVRVILDSPTCEGIGNTAYGLMQAGGEYLDHDRRYKNTDTLMGRTIFSQEKLKVRAKNLAVLAADGRL
jgi:phage/plasmid-like protein (TIGR03299 family)